MSEYYYLGVFVLVFTTVIFAAVDLGSNNWEFQFYTSFAFLLGAVTSVFSGFVGMKVGTYANSRTAFEA